MPMTASFFSDTMLYGEHVRISVAASQGGRRYMEDRVHIECVRLPSGAVDYLYFAVYDGHGGSEASDYVRKHLLKNIQSQCGFDGSDEQMLDAIKKGFVETHLAMWKVVDDWPLTSSGYTSTAGTTASCTFIRRGKIFTGHVGDSAVILGEMNNEEVRASSLTVDHKPDSSLEVQRINSAGGMVMKKSGVTRVVWTRPIRGHVGPVRRSTPTESIAFLAVARALGDLWSYNRETKQFIVSPEPDVAAYDLNDNSLCLVLGSDGLTNVLKPQQIVDIVMHYEKTSRDKHGRLPNHSRWILRHALEGWGASRADNISVISVFFDKKNIEVNNTSLLADDINLCLDRALTDFGNSTIVLGPKYCKQLRTLDVDLYYSGIVDPNFTTEIAYNGPGYTRDIRRPLTLVQFSDMPVMPLPSLDRVSAIHRLNELFGTNNKVKVLPAGCVAGVLLEGMDELYESFVDEGILYPCDEDVAREETVDNVQWEETVDNSNGDDNIEAEEMCGENSKANTNVYDVVTSLSASSAKYPSTSSSMNNVEHYNIPSSFSNTKSLFSSLASSSYSKTIKPKTVLKASRRKQAVCLKSVKEDAMSSVGSDNNVGEDCFGNNQLSSTNRCHDFEDLAVPQRPTGSASALSPSLMLEALRITNQLFEHDPFARDLILSRRRPFARRCRRLSSSSLEPLKKKLKVSMESHTDRAYDSSIRNVENLEQNIANANKVEECTAPTTSKFRMWDFFSSLLGNRANKK
uniref:PPM-type phosphatase domain-containing protein n=1 Tax=Wuchereria bancrofti TaxID=6293 RepID=A0AAF5PQK6_WUCBA